MDTGLIKILSTYQEMQINSGPSIFNPLSPVPLDGGGCGPEAGKRSADEVVGLHHDLSGVLVVVSGWPRRVPCLCTRHFHSRCAYVTVSCGSHCHHSNTRSHQISHNPILWMGELLPRGVKLFAQDPVAGIGSR